jgi:hypothetical protein
MAHQGDGTALHLFCQTVIEACEELDDIVRQHPEVVRPLARQCLAWPLLVSERSFQPKKAEEACALLKNIELAQGLPFVVDKEAGWRKEPPAWIALDLFAYVARFVRPRQPLPTPTRATVEQWWKPAESAFLRSYRKPEAIQEFQELVPPSRRDRGPASRRADILRTIHRSFVALLP